MTRPLVITGRVLDGRGQPVTDCQVEAWAMERTFDEPLAIDSVDNTGRFILEVKDLLTLLRVAKFKPDVFFKVRRGGLIQLVTDVLWFHAAPAEVTIRLDVASTEDSAEYVVRGAVRKPDGAPLTGAAVKAFDRDLRREEVLGEVRTDARGMYLIRYRQSQFRRAEKLRADLVVRVYGGATQVIVESPILFNAPEDATIDLIVGVGVAGELSEYELLLAEIEPVLDGVAIFDLTEQDLSFLESECEVALEQLLILRAAFTAQRSYDIPAAVFYAFGFAGLGTVAAEFLRFGTDTWRRTLETALSLNRIPQGLQAMLPDILAKLERLRVSQTLAETPQPGAVPIAEVLTLALPAAADRTVFIDVYLQPFGSIEAFWTALAGVAGFDAGKIKAIQDAIRASVVAHNHLPTTRKIRDRVGAGGTFEQLVSLDAAGWLALVNAPVAAGATQFPADIAGATPAEQRQNYAEMLSLVIENAYPTAAVRARVAQQGGPLAADISTFLSRNPAFDIRRTNLKRYVETTPAPFQNLVNPSATLEWLGGTQRMLRLSDQYATASRLMADGFHSAVSIASVSEQGFLQSYASSLGVDHATRIYRRAQTVAGSSLLLFTNYGARTQAKTNLAAWFEWPNTVNGVPEWRSLFGSIDSCECEHCLSVFGPAAYYVDLLDFVRQRGMFTQLDQQRPDLQHIELDCENSLTQLPYIDLVNEVLEREMHLQTRATVPHPADPPPSYQTTRSSKELAVTPEHRIDRVYDEVLSNAVFPQSLPFDLRLAQARTFLRHLGVERAALIELVTGALAEWAAQEVLGTSETEWALFSSDPTARVHDLWGIAVTDTWSRIESVRTVLSLTGLNYAGLIEVLAMPYVWGAEQVDGEWNGTPPRFTVGDSEAAADLCDVDLLEVREFSDSSDPDAFAGRLHRFVRVLAKLGWSARDLDTAIRVVGSGLLDVNTLGHLAEVVDLARTLNLPVEQVLTFFGSMEAASEDSLYERTFRNPTVFNPIPAAFAPGGTLSGNFAANGAQVAAALGLSTAELSTALQILAVAPDAQQFTLQQLSEVHALSRLARALRLKMDELASYARLLGQRPFAPSDTTLARKFVRDVAALRAGSFSSTELVYLYEHSAEAVRQEGLDRLEVLTFLRSVHDELRRIVQQSQLAGAPTREDAQRVLSVLTRSADELLAFVATIPADSLENRARLQLLFAPAATADKSDTLFAAVPPTDDAARQKFLQSAYAFLWTLASDEATAVARRNAIVERAASTFSIDTGTASELLESVVRVVGGGVPAIEAYQELFGTGLQVTYTPSTFPAETAANVDFAWGTSSPLPGTLRTAFQARLSGRLLSLSDEPVVFRLKGRGDVSLRIGSTVLLPKTGSVQSFNASLAPLVLAAGQRHDIEIDFAVDSGEAALSLEWAVGKGASNVIPEGFFFAPNAPANLDATLLTHQRLAKATRLVEELDLTVEELRHLVDHSVDFAAFDFNALPVVAVGDPSLQVRGHRELLSYVMLRDSLPRGERTLLDLLRAASAPIPDPDLLELAGSVLGIEKTELAVILANLPTLQGSASLRFPAALTTVLRLHAEARRVGVNAATLFSWLEPRLERPAAESIQAAAKSRHDEQRWLEIAEPLMDELREQQRAALVAWVRTHPRSAGGTPLWSDANEMFAYFLIDVEMSACQLTSRIVQATNSVQLLVQRVLLGLEPALNLNEVDQKSWRTWMHRYRLWEANRRVFFYPENFIRAELRDDKTPFFRELEEELLQGDITEERVEAALRDYLVKVHDVSRLEVRACYQQQESGTYNESATDVLHVFARTRGTPHRYFYRKLADSRTWSPWERIDVDIESEYLVPVLYNRRLHLFWFIAEERATEGNIPAANQAGEKAPKELTFKLAWSVHDGRKFGAKRVGDAAFTNLSIPKFKAHERQTLYEFRPRFVGSDLFIDAYGDSLDPNPNQVLKKDKNPRVVETSEFDLNTRKTLTKFGQFEFSCDGRVRFVAIPAADRIRLSAPGATMLRNGLYDQESTVGLSLGLGGTQKVLGVTPWPVSVVVAAEGNALGTAGPLFMQDDRHSFLVVPTSLPLDLVDCFRPNQVQLLGSDASLEAGLYRTRVADPSPFELAAGSALPPSFPTQIVLQQPAEAPIILLSIKAAGLPQTADTVAPLFKYARDLGRRTRPRIAQAVQPIAWQYSHSYRFELFQHPYACTFLRELDRGGIAALQRRELQVRPESFTAGAAELSFGGSYQPAAAVDTPYPAFGVDFGEPFGKEGAYSDYNWEIFFHIPLLIAERLSENQKFQEAQRWFHYIFDPTNRDTRYPVPDRYWQTKPFVEDAAGVSIDRIARILASGQNSTEQTALQHQVRQWQENPFNPHLLARMRPGVYPRAVVMKYIDNLIRWGDFEFRQERLESLNQATQLYILAAELLGPRPQKVTPFATRPDESFASLSGDLGILGNALVEFENIVQLPQSAQLPLGRPGLPNLSRLFTLRRFRDSGADFFETLYFCRPGNEQLLQLWDTIDDRLFKLRHCMDIEGRTRQLPLFEPPIDPALLVRAAALGIDINSALNESRAPVPYYRFDRQMQVAKEMVADVRGLGAALLSALERRDAESLEQLRAGHQVELLKRIETVRKQEIGAAKETILALEQAKGNAQVRADYYRTREFMSGGEKSQLALTATSMVLQAIGQGMETAAGGASLVPQFEFGGAGWAATPVGITTFGGDNISKSLANWGRALSSLGSIASTAASMAGTMAGYQRRQDDWKHQQDLAENDLRRIERELAGANIRLAMAERELENHQLQIEQSEQVREFYRDKFTSKELYSWMVSQLSGLFFQSYQLAYDLAKRAERAYRHERARTDSFINFGHWDSLRKGLLSGERLALDLRRLEAGHLEAGRRDYEITKHVALTLLDARALVSLRQTGRAVIDLTEAHFDEDHPGHYLRRLRTVSITIPAVTGPYTSINAKLTLLAHSTRVDPTLANTGYAREVDASGAALDDPRFVDGVGTVQSIVTSSARNDAGVFADSAQDGRLLPFEGAGAISHWLIELPRATNRFDFDTLADVILHLNYTAREGGGLLQAAALASLADGRERTQLVSSRYGSPDAWQRFVTATPTGTARVLELAWERDRFAYEHPDWQLDLISVRAFVIPDGTATPPVVSGDLIAPNGSTIPVILNGSSFTVPKALGAFRLQAPLGNSIAGVKDILWVIRYDVRGPR